MAATAVHSVPIISPVSIKNASPFLHIMSARINSVAQPATVPPRDILPEDSSRSSADGGRTPSHSPAPKKMSRCCTIRAASSTYIIIIPDERDVSTVSHQSQVSIAETDEILGSYPQTISPFSQESGGGSLFNRHQPAPSLNRVSSTQ